VVGTWPASTGTCSLMNLWSKTSITSCWRISLSSFRSSTIHTLAPAHRSPHPEPYLTRLGYASLGVQRVGTGGSFVGVDGLTMASALPADVEEDRVAAMSAAMLSLGERIATELGRGTLDQVYIKGEKGYVVLMAVGQEAVLTVLARQQAKLGLLFLDMRRAAEDRRGQ